MKEILEVQKIKLQEEDLESLERQLMIASSKGDFRNGGKRLGFKHEESEDLTEIADEIIENVRYGVDIASFSESHPLIPMFKIEGKKVPPKFAVDYEKMGYDFYLVEVSFKTMLANDQYPLKAQLNLVLQDDVSDKNRQIRPVSLFPSRTDVSLFKVDVEGGVGVNAEMGLSVPMADNAAIPLKKLEVNAKLKANMVVGPFSFSFRKSEIQVSGEQSSNIQWRYNFQSVITGTHDFKCMMILKTAREARQAKMQVQLKVVPAKEHWLFFKKLLPELTDSRELHIELSHDN